jgi:hypothetical protein
VAKELLEKLGPEVRVGVVPGKGFKLPDPANETTTAENESTASGAASEVKLDDLKDLLPQ